MATPSKSKKLPAEYEDVATQVADVETRVFDRMEKCYSEERYKKFQEDVEKIVLKTLGHEDGEEKIHKHIKVIVKEELDGRAWKTKAFWIPTFLAIVALLANIALAFKP